MLKAATDVTQLSLTQADTESYVAQLLGKQGKERRQVVSAPLFASRITRARSGLAGCGSTP